MLLGLWLQFHFWFAKRDPYGGDNVALVAKSRAINSCCAFAGFDSFRESEREKGTVSTEADVVQIVGGEIMIMILCCH